MSEKCDRLMRQIEDERYERAICKFLRPAERRYIMSEKDK